jgi:hypothetical protein
MIEFDIVDETVFYRLYAWFLCPTSFVISNLMQSAQAAGKRARQVPAGSAQPGQVVGPSDLKSEGSGSEIQVVGVLDDMYMDNSFNGAPVLRAAELSACVWDGVLITTLNGLEAEEAQLRDRGLVEEQIWRLA